MPETGRRPCPVTRFEAIPLRAPSDTGDPLDTIAETILVVLTDAEGRQGVGEADAPATVVKAFLDMPAEHLWSQGFRDLVIGADPMDRTGLWSRLYDATIWSGRRGLGIHALSAVDIALCDLAGKQAGLPVWKLMGGARRDHLRPYCTIYPGLPAPGRGIPELMAETARQVEAAFAAGFRAMKLEVLFYDAVTDAELAGLIADGRRMLGDGIPMMLDFGYRWRNWRDAAWLLERIADCDVHFAEATLPHDDLDGHRRLAARAPMRLCGAEMAATRFEIREWIATGGVDVVQPDISRAGGLTEMARIADLCELHGVEVIPHGWKTGVLAHAGLHFQAISAASPFVEYVSPFVCASTLRRDLVSPEPCVTEGTIPLPQAAGLGFDLDWEVVSRYRAGRQE